MLSCCSNQNPRGYVMAQSSNAIRKFTLNDDGVFPNNPKWPLLIYPAAVALTSDESALAVERVFRENGWGGMWRNGIYTFQHYHSNAHEVLGVFSGSARVQFGGPNGVEVELHAGDVAVLPAGTAHKNLGSSADFGVVGAYPTGAHYDMCRGNKEERSSAKKNIQRVPKPATDPVFGEQGGLIEHWAD